MVTVGDNIRKFRKAKGLTQKELGEKSGMTEAMIRQYELGLRNPKLETIKKIADGLNVFITDLINSEIEYTRPDDNVSTSNPIEIRDKGQKRESLLLYNYRQLNENGQKEAVKRVSDLTYNPKYKKDEK